MDDRYGSREQPRKRKQHQDTPDRGSISANVTEYTFELSSYQNTLKCLRLPPPRDLGTLLDRAGATMRSNSVVVPNPDRPAHLVWAALVAQARHMTPYDRKLPPETTVERAERERLQPFWDEDDRPWRERQIQLEAELRAERERVHQFLASLPSEIMIGGRSYKVGRNEANTAPVTILDVQGLNEFNLDDLPAVLVGTAFNVCRLTGSTYIGYFKPNELEDARRQLAEDEAAKTIPRRSYLHAHGVRTYEVTGEVLSNDEMGTRSSTYLEIAREDLERSKILVAEYPSRVEELKARMEELRADKLAAQIQPIGEPGPGKILREIVLPQVDALFKSARLAELLIRGEEPRSSEWPSIALMVAGRQGYVTMREIPLTFFPLAPTWRFYQGEEPWWIFFKGEDLRALDATMVPEKRNQSQVFTWHTAPEFVIRVRPVVDE